MLSTRFRTNNADSRRGIVLVLAAVVLVMVFAFVAFTVDIGHVTMTKAELQATADAAAMGSVMRLADGSANVEDEAIRIAAANVAANDTVTLSSSDIELGYYDRDAGSFTVDPTAPNAVKVTARATDQEHFFAPVMGSSRFDSSATSVAVLSPRDVVFVIDLSGSMNDDTEPLWATPALDAEFSSATYPHVASNLMQDVFDDFDFGTYPGGYVMLGAPLGVAPDSWAYAEMTKDDGPLTDPTLDSKYRIANADSETTRKEKAYRWVIDHQIATAMPNVVPPADSDNFYEYWRAYLDYIMAAKAVGTPDDDDDDDDDDDGIGGGGSVDPGPTPPPAVGFLDFESPFRHELDLRTLAQPGKLASVGNSATSLLFSVPFGSTGPGMPRNGNSVYQWLPANHDNDRVTGFNNPNKISFPNLSEPWAWRNKIGYITYVQFMMDWGRERSPDIGNSTNSASLVGTKTPLSLQSPYCPLHSETTVGGTFDFPPRAQPMHSVRRALIAGLQRVKERNAGLTTGTGDRVAIVTFDGQDTYHAATVVQPLTGDYTAAMNACTTLQASADLGATTATDDGMQLARTHLEVRNTVTNPTNDPIGPQGRSFTTKVIVLITDGMPNAWSMSPTGISSGIANLPHSDYYDPGFDWFNSVLVHARRFHKEDNGRMYAVGMGLGADYEFMDRIARISETDDGGFSPRSSGNPAHYEGQLTDILDKIMTGGGSQLVQ